MKKTAFIIVLVSLTLLSCTNSGKKQDSVLSADTTETTTYPLPENYTQVGNLHTDTLIFKGFSMGDLAHFQFQDATDKVYDFNVVDDSRYALIGDASELSVDNGGYEAKDEYLNKKFIVIWRTLQLNREPKDEIELYYEKYNEILSLELVE